MEEILLGKANRKILLLGNEAVVRGALEAGVDFISTYPGTPASEIGDTFAKISNFQLPSNAAKVEKKESSSTSISKQKRNNFYFEYSTNEKVAMEAAIGASFSGLRCLVAMKSFGLNVALESLIPFLYTGSKGSTVIVVADDPNCWSSAQSEENSRGFAFLTHIPILEPSDAQEAKDFTKLAFGLSEEFKVPVMVRLTTRVSHQRMPVELGRLSIPGRVPGIFEKEPRRFVTMPPRVLEMKAELLEKIEKIKEFSEKSPINQIYREQFSVDSKMGIITSGISYLYVREALKELNLSLPVLKLGFFYPLPENKIKNFIKKLNKVLIVEELEPYIEKEVERLAKDVNQKLKIVGKDLLPEIGELKPEIVTLAVSKFTNKRYKIPDTRCKIQAPRRFPQLCPGCPYWLVFSAIKKVAPKNTIFGGDIGCYMLAGLPPHEIQDYLSCMGSSIGIAHGIKKATSQKLITFVGDSTFFHAGIPALINTVFNKSNPLIIILDNQITAMTGQQPNPGTPNKEEGIKIEDIVKGCGVKNLKVIDPKNQKEFIKTLKEFLNKDEVSVIIARHPCIFLQKRKK